MFEGARQYKYVCCHVATYSRETIFRVNSITDYNLIMTPDFIYGEDSFEEITQNKTNIVIT